MGNTALAEKHLREALKMDPDNVKVQRFLKNTKKAELLKNEASQEFKGGNYEKAVEKFTSVIELDPVNDVFNSTIYLNRAIAYSKMEEEKQALMDVNQAIALNPEYGKAYVKRGDINLALGNYEESVRDFERARQIDPTQFNVREKLKHAQLELKKSKRKDYYKLLGVEKTATEDEIKKGYRKQALRWHPDKNQGDEATKAHAEKMFKDIGEAYAILSDPKKRQMFDNGVDPENMDQPNMGDAQDIFRMFFGGGGGGPGGPGEFFFSSGGGGGGGGFPFGGGFGGGRGGARTEFRFV